MDTYTFEQHGDFGRDADELLAPEIVFRVAKKLDKCDQRAPRVRTMNDEALQ